MDRSPGQGADSYSAAVDALGHGEVVALFPQGTIRHDREVGELRSGAVRMAAQSGAVIVPVGCSGTQKLWTKGRRPRLGGRRVTVHVVVGEPFSVGEDVPAGTRELQDRLQAVKDLADAAAGDHSSSGR